MPDFAWLFGKYFFCLTCLTCGNHVFFVKNTKIDKFNTGKSEDPWEIIKLWDIISTRWANFYFFLSNNHKTTKKSKEPTCSYMRQPLWLQSTKQFNHFPSQQNSSWLKNNSIKFGNGVQLTPFTSLGT